MSETLFEGRASDGTPILTVYLSASYSNGSHLPMELAALRGRLHDEVRTLARRCAFRRCC